MERVQQLFDNKMINQSDATAFIEFLINPKVKIDEKVNVLQHFTNKEIKQKELTYIVNSLIQSMYPKQPSYEGSICVCGTGGDKSNSFNVSTTVSFVVASAGIPVIKHGNKSITSSSGSTDLLKELGIETTLVRDVPFQVKEKGLAFISAMQAYPIMKYIQPVRKMIKTPTIFNIMGPLINPYKLTYQVMGVYDDSKLKMIAQTLRDLGRRRAIVLHGANGMDEATLSGDNEIYEVKEDGLIEHYYINAKDFGLKQTDNSALQGGNARKNRHITLDILSGRDRSCKRDVVVLNAALGLYIAEKVETIENGIKYAQDLIDTGSAMKQYLLMGGIPYDHT
ncbi:anthranilate phosphoribosyltransferase [Staphylococcus taiwanensis]|nr:anthranilate phosphoribosyltransferase [Staphylococcus taiwanensis]